jgi:hypothetical protein
MACIELSVNNWALSYTVKLLLIVVVIIIIITTTTVVGSM